MRPPSAAKRFPRASIAMLLRPTKPAEVPVPSIQVDVPLVPARVDTLPSATTRMRLYSAMYMKPDAASKATLERPLSTAEDTVPFRQFVFEQRIPTTVVTWYALPGYTEGIAVDRLEEEVVGEPDADTEAPPVPLRLPVADAEAQPLPRALPDCEAEAHAVLTAVLLPAPLAEPEAVPLRVALGVAVLLGDAEAEKVAADERTRRMRLFPESATNMTPLASTTTPVGLDK